jgi:hypothetical protein
VPVDDPELSATSGDGGDTTALDLGSGGGGGGFDAGGGGSIDSGAGSSGGVPSTPARSAPRRSRGDRQRPVRRPPSPARSPPRLGRSRPRAASTPWPSNALTWVSLIGGAGLLAAVSLALGAPVQAAGQTAPAGRPGGVASALARRTTRLG